MNPMEEFGAHNVTGSFDEHDTIWNVLRMKGGQGSVVITKDKDSGLYHWRPLRPVREPEV